jgi:penicillin-binding protein 1A
VTAVRRICFPKAAGGFKCQDEKTHRHKAFEDGVTAKATEILKMNVEKGTGTKAQYGCPAAGKTGTVDDFTDAWFVGYTPRLSTAVWVGHATEKRTLGPGAAGGEVAAPIWGAYMKVAHGGFCGDFQPPKQPFVASPFFGKYSQTGVQDNKVDPGSYTTSTNGGSSLETGKSKGSNGANGTGTGNGSQQYPPDAYKSPPQGTPNTQTPTTPQTPTPTTPSTGGGTAGPAGGTAPPP